MKKLFLTLLFMLMAVSANAFGLKFEKQKARVIFVEDGSSIFLKFFAGREYKAKLIGFDAPHQNPIEEKSVCFYEKSRDYLRNIIDGEEVTVEFDSGGKVTKDGAILVYINYKFLDVNAQLLRSGSGWIPEYKFDKEKDYKELETAAKAKTVGFWGQCSGIDSKKESTVPETVSDEEKEKTKDQKTQDN
jgi:endonuclease YncB( thermonuclease family)